MHSFRLAKKALGVLGYVVLCVGFLSVQICCPTGEKPVGATVFIHGTMMSAFVIVPRILERYRAHAFTPFDQITGEDGVLSEYQISGVDDAVVCDTLPIAENFIIPAYHAAAQAVGMAHPIERYFTFGWSGLLSRLERRQAANNLYGALVTLRDEIKKATGVEPELRIVAHSYGGEVAELLSEAEEHHGNNLRISWLCMYGTPMHAGSVDSLLSPIFEKIVLFSSPGDRIQPIDIISTNGHKRARTRMADVVPGIERFVQKNISLKRCDVHICVGNKTRHITHTNMWLMGRCRPIFPGFLDELPLVVLTPLCMKTLAQDQCAHTSYRLTLQADDTACWACLAQDEHLHRVCKCHKRAGCMCCARNKRAAARSPREPQKLLECRLECRDGACRLYDVLREWDLKAHTVWRPCDPSRNVVINHKNFEIIKSFLWPW